MHTLGQGLRSLLFSLLFTLWLLGLGLCCLPLLILPRRFTVALARFWGRGVIWLLKYVVGIAYRLEGLNHLPATPCIIAAKHQSTFETIALFSLIQPTVFILKRELLWLPFYGWYVAKSGMIPIDRGGGASALRKIVARARQAVGKGYKLVIFPEGTRTRPGEQTPYQNGVAALYSQLNIPVVPLALNSGLYWGRRQWLKRPGTIVLQVLPPIAPGLDKKTFMASLTEKLETASLKLLESSHDRD